MVSVKVSSLSRRLQVYVSGPLVGLPTAKSAPFTITDEINCSEADSLSFHISNQHELNQERDAILSGGRFHYLHWLVILASFLLTAAFSWYSKIQIDEKTEAQFLKEADQIIELVSERMRKYEDALWGGVAAIMANGDVSHAEWKRYAKNLRLEKKYPGINGIGVIYRIPKPELPAFLEKQRKDRPAFGLHPPHDEDEFWPITYIEPVAINSAAVGLDMAHEENRYTAARKARDSGDAHITGPITLVQDESKTPGFLFYAPAYQGGDVAREDNRRERFLGLVYAPFIVKELMAGTLDKSKRHVGLQISDGDFTLYDEHLESEPDYDRRPLFEKTYTIDLYGRTWTFDIRSNKSFRSAISNAQPFVILFSGILIDSLLILLFVLLTRSNRRAISFADKMTTELQNKAESLEDEIVTRKRIERALETKAQSLESEIVRRTAIEKRLEAQTRDLTRSNEELEQFAFVASHDLQEPLRMISTFTQMLAKSFEGRLGEETKVHMGFIVDGVKRMKKLIDDLLTFSQVEKRRMPPDFLDCNDALSAALQNLQTSLMEHDVEIIQDQLPSVKANRTQVIQLLQNLISNAIKYRSKNPPVIRISAALQKNMWLFSVQDNGIGFEKQYADRIFSLFQRLHKKTDYPGTGIGLSICKKIVGNMGGKIWAESQPGVGSVFYFTIPNNGGILIDPKGAEKDHAVLADGQR